MSSRWQLFHFVTCPYLGILVSHEGYDEGDDVAAVVEVRVGHQEVTQAPDANLLQALASHAERKNKQNVRYSEHIKKLMK